MKLAIYSLIAANAVISVSARSISAGHKLQERSLRGAYNQVERLAVRLLTREEESSPEPAESFATLLPTGVDGVVPSYGTRTATDYIPTGTAPIVFHTGVGMPFPESYFPTGRPKQDTKDSTTSSNTLPVSGGTDRATASAPTLSAEKVKLQF
ncbi:hypothetical protein RUND412_005020 [Rhizina undulata]